MKLTLHEIAKVVGAKNDVTAYKDVALNQIEFDSRKITAGDLFLPLKGARDGHDFIQTAFDNGAIATFTEKELPADQAHILVDDTLEAFQELAAYYLEKTGVDVIAVLTWNSSVAVTRLLKVKCKCKTVCLMVVSCLCHVIQSLILSCQAILKWYALEMVQSLQSLS